MCNLVVGLEKVVLPHEQDYEDKRFPSSFPLATKACLFLRDRWRGAMAEMQTKAICTLSVIDQKD